MRGLYAIFELTPKCDGFAFGGQSIRTRDATLSLQMALHPLRNTSSEGVGRLISLKYRLIPLK